MFDWLVKEMEDRGWSQRELARLSGVNYTTVSKVMSGQAKVTFNFCAAISKPLDKQPIEVFRIAGLLPPSSGKVDELSEDEAELIKLYRQLSPGEVRSYALSFLRGFVEQMRG